MPHCWKTEYHVCSEDGAAYDWLDSLDEAIAIASADEEPCYVEEVREYLADKRIVWASHKSMVEVEQ